MNNLVITEESFVLHYNAKKAYKSVAKQTQTNTWLLVLLIYPIT